MTGRSVFDSPFSARPGGSEAAGGREKTKTRKHRGPGGADPLSAVRPSPKGAQGRGPEGRWAGRTDGRRAGSVGSVHEMGYRGGCAVAWVARMHGNPPVLK